MSSLGQVAARGAALMFSGQLARVLVQTVSVVVLGRLLSPTDFGVLAMVVSVIGIGALLRDFGLGQAAVQAREINHGQKSNLFWINTGIGLIVTVAVLVGAPGIAALYHDPDLTPVVAALSVTLLLGGAATQFRAELSRHLRFRAIVLTEISAQAAGVCVVILLAIGGAGYWALVAQQITEAALILAGAAVASRWVPSLPSRQPMGGLLRFGWGLLGTQTVLYISQNIDSFVIGRRFGAEALGFYNRAFQLLMLPLNQISAPATKVALPVLSRLQDEEKQFDDYLLRANLLVGATVIIGLSFCAAQAHAIVGLLLGSQWQQAVPLFQILAVAGCFQSLSYATYWIFLSRGRTASNLRFTLISRSVVAAGIVAASTVDVAAVAAVYSVGLALCWPAGLLWVRKLGPSRRLFLQGLRLLGYGLAIGLSAWGTTLIPGFDGALSSLALGLVATCGACGILFALFPQVRVDARQVAHSVHLMRRRTH